MYCRTFSEGEPFRCAGNEYVMLLPREVTGCCEAVLEKVPPGRRTPPNAHSTFNQIYIVLSGECELTIGESTRRVSAPAVAYIPQNASHYAVNVGNVELRYLYVTVWPNGIPANENTGDWRQAYQNIIQEYVDRGYSVDQGCR